jgi:hypothetical protein
MNLTTPSSIFAASHAAPPQGASVYAALSHLEHMYPGFKKWFWHTVLPGLDDGTRRMFIKEHESKIIGVVIAKSNCDERKLCTVWVDPGFLGHGLGKDLMRSAMEWLNTDQPTISVPEERLSEFRRIFATWGFRLTQTLDSYYRPGRLEYIFNGALPMRLRQLQASYDQRCA